MDGDYFSHRYDDSRNRPFGWSLQPPPSPTIGPFMSLDTYTNCGERKDLSGMASTKHRQMSVRREREQTHYLHGVDEYDPPQRNTSNVFRPVDPLALQMRLVHDDSFLNTCPGGDATITFPGNDGTISFLYNINADTFEARCPLLAASFEPCSGGLKLHLERLNSSTALPFLRYMYTGTYAVAPTPGGDLEDVPTSVLLHSQLYDVGDLYDIPDLKSQAYVNVLRQCEFGCSSPDRPIELCAAIQYIYKNLRKHKNLVDTIVNYCVTNFLRHRLADDEDFRGLPVGFHQELCRNCMSRDIDNDVACAIVQLPCQIKASSADRKSSVGTNTVNRPPRTEEEDFSKKRKRIDRPAEWVSNLSLALRPRNPFKDPVTDDSASDVDGFEVVRKRRASSGSQVTLNPNNPDSSSDDGFELVARSSSDSRAVIVENESDLDAFVKIECPESGRGHQTSGLPLRPRSKINHQDPTESSDSEWFCV